MPTFGLGETKQNTLSTGHLPVLCVLKVFNVFHNPFLKQFTVLVQLNVSDIPAS